MEERLTGEFVRCDLQVERATASVAEGLASIERGEGVESIPKVWAEIEREAHERFGLGVQPKRWLPVSAGSFSHRRLEAILRDVLP